MSGPRIQVAQPGYDSIAGFRGVTVIPIVYIVIDYLEVGPGSAPDDWAVVSGIYGTHLKHEQYLLLSV